MRRASIARRRLGAGELIQVGGVENKRPPASFTWRRRRYRIRMIEARGEEPAASAGRGRIQRWYTVCTTDGLRAQLLHDLGRDQWRMGAVLGRKGG